MSYFRDLRDMVNMSRLTYRDSDESDDDDRDGGGGGGGLDEQPSNGGAANRMPTPRRTTPTAIGSSSNMNSNSNSGGESKASRYIQSPRPSSAFQTAHYLRDIESIVTPRHVAAAAFGTSRGMVFADLEEADDDDDDDNDNDEDNADGNNKRNKRKANYPTAPTPVAVVSETAAAAAKINFDNLLTYVDASVISDWLCRANRILRKMSRWHAENTWTSAANQNAAAGSWSRAPPTALMLPYESFMLFAHFWLAQFSDKERRGLIELEYTILCDELTRVFQIGLDAQRVHMSELRHLLGAVFREYPRQLFAFRGSYLLLDFVDTLCSMRSDKYKELLANIKCSTTNKQCAQWLLSIRSFALISLCWSVIRFYLKQSDKERNEAKVNIEINSPSGSSSSSSSSAASSASSSRHSSTRSLNLNAAAASRLKSASGSSIASTSRKHHHHHQPNAIPSALKYEMYLQVTLKHDLADVLHYLLSTKKCDPYARDEHGRTLVFLAVMNDAPTVLNYLIKRWPSIDVNEACDSGNTPLHVAVNKGKLNLVEILVRNAAPPPPLKSNQETNGGDTTQDATSSKHNNHLTSSSSSSRIHLNVDKVNEKCMDATALHLAVWNNYEEIAYQLIEARANPMLKMNGASTAFDLANENANPVMHDLLCKFSHFSLGNTNTSNNNNNNNDHNNKDAQ